MWYDLFSLFYDPALERLYAPFRPAVVDALRPPAGSRVLDFPCGTGQSFDALVPAVGSSGFVLGVDRSAGMLRKAGNHIRRAGWDNVVLRQADAEALDASLIQDALGTSTIDGVLCSLGLTAIPDWEDAFGRMFSLLRPGGRFVLFDVHAPERTWASRSVELTARADLSRRAWLPLEARCEDFTREVLPADMRTFGGELYIASGTKPAA